MLNDTTVLSQQHKEILDQARETYGDKNQILVCMEELNELACVLAKYPRYEDSDAATNELFDRVLDEVADVTIILEHVCQIFSIDANDLSDRVDRKIERLQRWLSHSDSMQETIDDRTIKCSVRDLCNGCDLSKECTAEDYQSRCVFCLKAQATEGIAPYWNTVREERA